MRNLQNSQNIFILQTDTISEIYFFVEKTYTIKMLPTMVVFILPKEKFPNTWELKNQTLRNRLKGK